MKRSETDLNNWTPSALKESRDTECFLSDLPRFSSHLGVIVPSYSSIIKLSVLP